ncbi:MAG: gas vesicle protein GvpO [Pseudorhodobacter sp.]|nr:gas vesicle protein GvpO [Pseudorhodobacter sp.]
MKSQTEKRYAPPRVPRLVDIIEGAKLQFGIMVSYPIDSVTGVKKVEDGWHLLLTLIELSRIPSGSDVLAEYSVSLDQAGEIVSYRQGRRFFRNQVSTDDGE